MSDICDRIVIKSNQIKSKKEKKISEAEKKITDRNVTKTDDDGSPR